MGLVGFGFRRSPRQSWGGRGQGGGARTWVDNSVQHVPQHHCGFYRSHLGGGNESTQKVQAKGDQGFSM
jgi:hypothetical protein